MRKLITFFLLIPILSFSQSERDQKTSIRNGTYVTPTPSTQSFKGISESTQKYDIRQNLTRPNNNQQNYYNPYSFNRWYRWGAPSYGYSFYDDWYFYDRFGFRQPARIYVYNDGKRDTIRGNKTHIRTGISYTTLNQLGGWLTIGNSHYFIMEYLTRNPEDISTFYNDITMDLAASWNDSRVGDLVRDNIFYTGFGKKTSEWNFHVLVGFGQKKVNFQYYDDLMILSNNGFYSFRNYQNRYTTLKIGVIRDYKLLSIKGDYDPFRNTFNLGLGIIW